MKKFIMGLIVGSFLCVSITAYAAPVKQFILNLASYPLFVNGVEYNDADKPILTYKGSTYVPLAKLSDITGVNYKWNATAKRVEIITNGLATSNETVGISTEQVDDPLTLKAQGEAAEKESIENMNNENSITYSSVFVEDNGYQVFQAYDIDGDFMGRFTDDDDVALIEYDMNNELVGSSGSVEVLPPPKLSEGWVSEGLLEHIFNYKITYGNSNKSLVISKSAVGTTYAKELITLTFPDEWSNKTIKDVSIEGVKIKKYDNGIYFNIQDLQLANVIG